MFAGKIALVVGGLVVVFLSLDTMTVKQRIAGVIMGAILFGVGLYLFLF